MRVRSINIDKHMINVALVPLSAFYVLMQWPFYHVAVVVGGVAAGRLIARLVAARGFIDVQLRSFMSDGPDPAVLAKAFPGFALPDFYYAVEEFVNGKSFRQIKSVHGPDLSGILNAEFYHDNFREVNVAPNTPWRTDVHREAYFPQDAFWLVRDTPRTILRLRVHPHTAKTILEVCTGETSYAQHVLETLRHQATRNSIYRGKALEMVYAEEIRDEYGDTSRAEAIELKFLSSASVSESDIILDDELERNIDELVFQYDAVRDRLGQYNLTKRRGLLFYGPPGTGKTYTSRYIISQLKHRTALVCHGKILSNIKVVANVAKLFTPSLVVLEDVDLVFSRREINYENNNLGEFLDILDGFDREEDVIFILSTNWLERVEDAIRNRPGRISQCIYMGPPNEELRRIYLQRILAHHHAACPDLDPVVRKSSGCTQAFLKELVQRGIQRAIVVHEGELPETLTLGPDLLLQVLHDMQSSGEDRSRSVIGLSAD